MRRVENPADRSRERGKPLISLDCRLVRADHLPMKVVSKLKNLAFVASVNLILAITSFLCFVFPRFSPWGRRLIPVTFIILILTGILFLRDVWRSGSRTRALLALGLCLPVLALYGILMVWEGPLYVGVKPGTPMRFQVRGPSGFFGLEIYGPDHHLVEWTSDDIGFVWGLAWNKSPAFPPMDSEFSYGELPAGFAQKTSELGPASLPVLDATATYTLVVQPAMGMPEYYSLHDGLIGKYEADPSVCWGALAVDGRTPATVRVDCVTHKPLPMSQRARDRLQAYQEHRLPYF
jgi:hypothetical protein